MQNEARSIQAILKRLATEGADAVKTAEAAEAIWHDVNAALSPIVGSYGVAALYKRSLHLTRVDYPWLTAVYEETIEPGQFAALRVALSQQTSSNAAAANGALLQAFCNLLTNLIGESLTERLLRPVGDNPSSGNAT